jgi:hypothetical protein
MGSALSAEGPSPFEGAMLIPRPTRAVVSRRSGDGRLQVHVVLFERFDGMRE